MRNLLIFVPLLYINISIICTKTIFHYILAPTFEFFGWKVNYKEKFILSDDEGSYTIIILKGNKINSSEEAAPNIFRNNELGIIVLIIENSLNKKKMRIFFIEDNIY